MRDLILNSEHHVDLSGLGTVVLPPEAVRGIRDAQAALDDAITRAHQIVATAEAQRSEITSLARQNGFDAGLADAKSKITSLHNTLSKIQKSKSPDTFDLAFEILKKLFGEGQTTDHFASAVHQAITELAPGQAIQVAICPQDEQAITDIMPDGAEVTLDPTLPPNTARLESELGLVTVNLDRQLALIRSLLEAQIEGTTR